MFRNSDSDSAPVPEFIEEPWNELSDIAEVELWIMQLDQRLQQVVERSYTLGHGIRLALVAGGSITVQTTGDGDVVLDIDADATWVTPVITAATRIPAPVGQLWVLPGDVLAQLIFGLNTLIGSSRLVLDHRMRARRPF